MYSCAITSSTALLVAPVMTRLVKHLIKRLNSLAFLTPGGPVLSKLAEKGNPNSIQFPRPMLDQPGFDFSFSGLKTAVAIYRKKHPRMNKANVAASFQAAAVETLVEKTLRAARKHKARAVAIAGGVAANIPLRHELRRSFDEHLPEVMVLEPNLKFTTDNAAMIGVAGGVRFLNGFTKPWDKITADPNLKLK